MAGLTRFDNDVFVIGHFTASTMDLPANAVTNASVSASAAIVRTKLEQNTLRSFPVPFTDFRVHDAIQTVLPGTSAADDLGLYGGTFGTTAPLIRTYDVKTVTATLYARALVRLPAEYDPGQSVSIRIKAGMVTTIADATCTLDVQAYEVDKEGGISADLVTTAAQSMNSLTFANKDFELSVGGLNPGEWLDVRIAVAVVDGSSATAVIAALGSIELLADIRG